MILVRQGRGVVAVGAVFFNEGATTDIYPLSLHDALPISCIAAALWPDRVRGLVSVDGYNVQNLAYAGEPAAPERSEEHTSELQSRQYLVCRLLLEKKN